MNKKVLSVFSSTLLIGGLLVGCGSEDTSSPAKESQEPPKQSEQKKVENPKKDENGNYILDKVGQKVTDDNATAELLKIKEVNEVVNIAPIEVTVQSIKLIKLTDMSAAMKEEIELWTGRKVNGPITYLQIRLTAENKEEKNIAWNGLSKVVTDQREQLDAGVNFLSSNFDTEFMGKVTQEDAYGLVLGSGKEDINKVKLIFNGSDDSTTYETITPEQQVEYTF